MRALCIWWRHQMETFSALLALCAGNSLVTGEFPSQRQVTRNFDVFFIYTRINGWLNKREASDLRRNRAHYDVIVMIIHETYCAINRIYLMPCNLSRSWAFIHFRLTAHKNSKLHITGHLFMGIHSLPMDSSKRDSNGEIFPQYVNM